MFNFRTLAAALGIALSIAAAPAQALYFSSVVAFGDSLSDNGASLTATTQTPPAAPPARTSDGPVLIEYLANALGSPLQDYAVGGARTDFVNSDILTGPLAATGMLSQIDRYRQNVGGVADSQALYFVFGGSNDLLDAMFTLDLTDPLVLDNVISSLIGNLTSGVQQLYDMQARRFLLPLLPDLGLTPEAASLGVASELTAISLLANSLLYDSYQLLFADKPDASFVVFDSFAAQNAIVSNPGQYGLSNGTDACIDAPGAPACSDFFFWDSLHPTTAASRLLAADMQAALGVPEPGTLALVGAAVLISLRRRRQQA